MLITNEQQLISAKHAHSEYSIPTYDDGFGQLYILRDSLGIRGIVRAQTWEDAWSVCEDEFLPEADETIDELVKEYGFRQEHIRVTDDNGQFVKWETRETPDSAAWSENELFCEAFGFRPNGPNHADKLNHGIYAKDLNGEYLDVLTSKLVDDLNITLEIREYEN